MQYYYSTWLLTDDKSSLLKENQTFIGVLNPYDNKDKIDNLVKNINIFSSDHQELQSTIYGYIIFSSKSCRVQSISGIFANFEKAIPMMMTAAGTIPAAKVLVVGAGVAGLQQALQQQNEWAQLFLQQI